MAVLGGEETDRNEAGGRRKDVDGVSREAVDGRRVDDQPEAGPFSEARGPGARREELVEAGRDRARRPRAAPRSRPCGAPRRLARRQRKTAGGARAHTVRAGASGTSGRRLPSFGFGATGADA
mgnify:CR=1 FL=1